MVESDLNEVGMADWSGQIGNRTEWKRAFKRVFCRFEDSSRDETCKRTIKGIKTMWFRHSKNFSVH
jgi:hypothetical protein